MISVIGYYTTRFGELWEKSLFELVKKAITGVLTDTKVDIDQVDAIFFGNMLGGVLENNLHSGAKIAEIVGKNIPVFRVESACASGGVAFHLATQYIKSGAAKNVLVVGAEKMTDFSPEQVVATLAAAASGEEQEAGLTFPGLYALIANYYLKKYNYTEEHLAHVSVKNHYHGSLNDKAQFKREITVKDVLKSAYVATPLKVLDSSPISDGASALLITNDQKFIKKALHSVSVLSCEVATDTISLKHRKNLATFEATVIAAKKAFKRAKVKRTDISVAEVHDCFSIAELVALEDLGFYKKGTAGDAYTKEPPMVGTNSKLVVNTSGGLKAAGHPVGATGVKQIGEIFLQLTGQATNRQVKNAKFGLAHNVGGSGGTAVVTILGS